MSKWTGRLRKLLNSPPENSPPRSTSKRETHLDETEGVDSEGQQYLERVRGKFRTLVEDFAQGRVNRAQFEELYAHYQKERRTIEALLTSRPTSDAWRLAVTEGQSVNIRRRLAARVLGYAVYANQDETPLRVYGEFTSLQEKWVAPLLARVNQVAKQRFVVTSFETGGDEASCLCAVSGQFTTVLVLFTTEPARVQMQSLEDLHCHFEQANSRVLEHYTNSSRPVEPTDLVFPYAAAFE